MAIGPAETNGGFVIAREVVAEDLQVPAIEQTFLDGTLAHLLCDRYENSKALIKTGEHWPAAVADFVPFIDAYARDDDHEDLARGLLARLLELSFRADSAQDKTVEEFTLGVLDMLSRLRHVPDSLMRPRTRGGDDLKRQPSFFESMMGTLRRYRFMKELPGVFNGIADGIIVGGSMGYGPFFSVRDGGSYADPSDVDAIVVLKDGYEQQEKWQTILASDKVENADKVSLLSRLRTFASMHEAGQIDIISQRFNIPHETFNMSAHFMTREFFEKMNGRQLRDDLAAGVDTVLAARDFKPRRFEHPVCAQRSFDGSVFEYVVPEQQELGDGLVAELPAYIIAEHKLYLGLYQNLISPEFDVLYDESGFTNRIVNEFRLTVAGYIKAARQRGERVSLSRSHMRSGYFAPGRYDHRANMATEPKADQSNT